MCGMCGTMAMSVYLIAFSALFHTIWGAVIPHDNLSIIGGTEISIGHAPYMVALFYNNKFICGGSIIHGQFILTAAHCVSYTSDNAKPQDIEVLFGSDRLNDGGIFIKVEKILVHEGYNNYTRHYHLYDIALLKLKQEVNGCFWSVLHQPPIIQLPTDSRDIVEGTMVNVTGWGIANNRRRTASNELRQTTLPVVSNSCCKLRYPSLVDRQICAGLQGYDACQGDSGGPLTYNGVQIGIVSYGDDCGRNPGVYTRVSSYLDWIKANIKNN